MVTDKGFRSLEELVDRLAEVKRKLADGSIGLEGLDQACDDAREAYERLVVLRHKAREARTAAAARKPAAAEAPQEQASETPQAAAEKAPEVAEPPPVAIRLDTRAGDAAPRQTSLIEAIEETEKPGKRKERAESKPQAAQVKKDTPADGPAKKKSDPTPSVAERLGKAPISNLGKSIALSQKFWFVAELFNGDRISYDRTIDLLDGMNDLGTARQYIEREVLTKLPAAAGEEVLATFMDLVERRFA